jgi:hypothetical protein
LVGTNDCGWVSAHSGQQATCDPEDRIPMLVQKRVCLRQKQQRS